jgi:hypothetical protein
VCVLVEGDVIELKGDLWLRRMLCERSEARKMLGRIEISSWRVFTIWTMTRFRDFYY